MLDLNWSYIHSIFSELGVNNRTFAVAKAKELGILPSTY
jgi:ATP/maltotriose-dependent transcriptional regulator MalT